MITDEEKKPKVLSTDDLLKRFNAQKAGTPGAINEDLDPWGTEPVDIDSMLSGQPSRPKVPEAKPVPQDTTKPTAEFDGTLDWKNLQKSKKDYEKEPRLSPKEYFQGLGNKVKSSVMGLGEMVMEIPQGIESLSNAPAVVLTEAMIRRKVRRGEMDPEAGDILMKEAKAITPRRTLTGNMVVTDQMPGEMLAEGDLNKWFEENKVKFSEIGDKYDKTATQYLTSGQFGKALGAISYGIAESIAPTIAAAFIPGGAAALGLGVGATSYDEVKDREDMSEAMKMADAVTVGVFEWLFERFGSREMGKALMDIYQKSGKEGVVKAFTSPATKNLIAKAYKKFGVWFAPVHEGISEGLTTLGQNAAAILSGEDPERKIQDGFWDSVLIGAGMGGMFSLTEKTAEKYRVAREGKAGPITGPLTIEDQDPEVMIRDLGKKYAYNGFNSELPDQNFIKYGEMKDGRKVIIKSTNFATDPANMLVAVVDAENPESKPQMVKGNMINNSMDVPYEQWVQNEMRNYQATMSQISNEAAKATAPVQEGATIPIGEQLFNVTQVTDQGIVLNEIDKEGNLTANTQTITPDKYGEVFGVGPAENEAPMPQEGVQQPNLTAEQPAAAPAQPKEVSPQSRKVSDGKNEFTIIPQEDGNFRMSESFETQKEAETALKKLQERYPKLTWSAEMTDSGDLFTPDTYTIVAAPKQKPAAPVAETPKVKPEQKPVEAPAAAPEVKAEVQQPVSQTPSAPDETAAEEEVQNAGEMETKRPIIVQAPKTEGSSIEIKPIATVDKMLNMKVADINAEWDDGWQETDDKVKPLEGEIKSLREQLKGIKGKGVKEQREKIQSRIKELNENIGVLRSSLDIMHFNRWEQFREWMVKELANRGVSINPDEDYEFLDEVMSAITTRPGVEWSWEMTANEVFDNIFQEWYGKKGQTEPPATKADQPEVAIAKAEGQVDLRPTEEQKKAGNYKKGHVNLLGFDISIENPAGSVRSGVSKDGTKWSNLMNNTYGYFRRTEGKDGDQVDVFLGDNLDSDAVYVVDQVDPETGIFDEHKTMLGFNSAESARENYLANYEPGWKGLGSITKMSLEGFKEWLGDAKRTRKPVDANVEGKKETAPVEQKQPEITPEPEALKYEYVPISEKAFVVKGDTRPVKDYLKSLRGMWNPKQKAWMFKMDRLDEIKGKLEAYVPEETEAAAPEFAGEVFEKKEEKPFFKEIDVTPVKHVPSEYKAPAYGSQNTVFTSDAAEKAREILRRKLGNLSAGIDPETMQAGITLAGYHIEAGARKFADYAKAMIGDMGDAIKPYLKSFYNAVRDWPGFNAEGMDSYETVSRAAVETQVKKSDQEGFEKHLLAITRNTGKVLGAIVDNKKDPQNQRIAVIHEVKKIVEDFYAENIRNILKDYGPTELSPALYERLADKILTDNRVRQHGFDLEGSIQEMLELQTLRQLPQGKKAEASYKAVEKAIPILSQLKIGGWYRSGEMGDAIMPFSIEVQHLNGYHRIYKDADAYMLVMEHNFIQEGDLMTDPRIDVAVYPTYKMIVPLNYEMNTMGVYKEYVANGNVIDQKGLDDTHRFIQDTWMPNLVAQGRVITEKDDQHAKEREISITTIENKAEAIISQSEAATDRESAGRAIEEIDRQIEEIGSQLTLLGEYKSPEGFIHEYPHKGIEAPFKKDLTKYSKELAKVLEWEHDTDRKGKTVYANTNIAPAGGDGTIILWMPNSEYGVYISVPVHPTGMDDKGYYSDIFAIEDVMGWGKPILWRITNKKDKYKGFSNQYVPSGITAGEFAKLIKKQAESYANSEKNRTFELPEIDNGNRNGDKSISDTSGKSASQVDGGLPAGQPGRNVPSAEASGLPRQESGVGREHNRPSDEGRQDQADGRGRSDRGTLSPAEGERTEMVPGAETDDTGDREKPEDLNARNHIIREDDFVPGGEIAKIKANIAAIKLLNKLEKQNRNATPEEKEVLAKYTGWGGLAAVLDEQKANWRKYGYEDTWNKKYGGYYDDIRKLLSDDEYRTAVNSTINAHYTSIPIIRQMWAMAEHLGFQGGNVLEPAGGIGHFIGAMPEKFGNATHFTSYELDSISGRILGKLYPEASVHVSGYEHSKLQPASQDLIITNVPFGKTAPLDTKYKDLSKFSLHNYFIAKGIRQLKPGGLGIFITSASTMDVPASMRFREWAVTDGNADLVGAIRLPNNAFKENAGTEVTTDILVFRKRNGEIPSEYAQDFRITKAIGQGKTDTGEKVDIEVNQYFADNPDNILGKMMLAHEAGSGGLYSGNSQTAAPIKGMDLIEAIKARIDAMPTGIMNTEASTGFTHKEKASAEDRDGTLINKDGTIYEVVEGELVEPEWTNQEVSIGGKKYKASKITAEYIEIKDAVNTLLELEQSEESKDEDIEATRKRLNKLYDKFVGSYKTFNKNRALEFLEDDSEFNMVLGLEDVEVEMKENKAGGMYRTYNIVKSPIFSQRVNYPVIEPSKAEGLEDAYNISLSYRNSLDVEYMAKLLESSSEKVSQALINEGFAYKNPKTGLLEDKDTYLSGYVKTKYNEAIAAANDDPEYQRNVDALKEVLPKDIPGQLIKFRLGSAWMPAKIIKDFIKHTTDLDIEVGWTPGVEKWSVHTPRYGAHSAKNNTSGTSDMTGLTLIEHALHLSRPRVVKKEWDGEKYVERTDAEGTAAAIGKMEEIMDDFVNFVYGNSDYVAQIEKVYNEQYNNFIEKKHSLPTFQHYPGASNDITLYEHQRKAVTRCVKGCTLLAHQVGTGKTFTMITAAMEMRRLNTAKKPMIVVQNATIEQFAKSFRTLYPAAKLLVAEKNDAKPDRRQKIFNRIAYGDWDAIILPQSFLNFIPDDPEREKAYIEERIAELQAVKDAAIEEVGSSWNNPVANEADNAIRALEKQLEKQNDKRKTKKVKDVAKSNLSVEKRVNTQLARRRDDVRIFEKMGVDALFVDEAHAYKKLGFSTSMTNVRGIDTKGSQRALSLRMKIRFIQEKMNGRNVVLATGTPISNTMAEVWTMMNYIAPDVLKEYHIETFDKFAGTYGVVEPSLEFTAAGKFKTVDRFKSYQNAPELMLAFRANSDIVLTEDVTEFKEKNTVPKLKNNEFTKIILPQTQGLQDAMARFKAIMEEWEKLSGKEKKEKRHIPLVVFGRAKQAAIDLRLLSPAYPDDPGSKTNAVVKQVKRIYDQTKHYKGTQLVFADMYQSPEGIGGGRFNLYEEIKRKLVKEGIPEAEIAIISDQADTKRAEIFDKINEGTIRVVMGSTERLGTGVNVQTLLAAVHHVDAPPRPMDFEQRNGRILRQGNTHAQMNLPVEVLTYGVEKTLDATAYQRLAIKQKFINQMMKGEGLDREVGDAADEELPTDMTFDHMMATLSGSQTAILYTFKQGELRKLRTAKQSYERSLIDAKDKLRNAKEGLARAKDRLAIAEEADKLLNERFADGKIKSLTITYKGKTIDVLAGIKERKEAVETLAGYFEKIQKDTLATETVPDKYENFNSTRARQNQLLINVNGFKGHVRYNPRSLADTYASPFVYDIEITPEMYRTINSGFTAASGFLISVEAQTKKMIDTLVSGERSTIEAHNKDIPVYEAALNKTFDRQVKLDAIEQEVRELEAKMQDEAKITDTSGSSAPVSTDLDLDNLFDEDSAPDQPEPSNGTEKGAMFRTSNQVYYSPIEKALEAIKQNKATAKQWKAMLLNNGAKQAELDWMGWDDMIEAGDPNRSLTKDDIQKWIADTKVEIKDVTLSDEKEYAKGRSLELKAEAGRRTISEVQEEIGFRPYRVAVTGEWVYRDSDGEVHEVEEQFIDDLDKADEAIQALNDFDEAHIDITGEYNLGGTKYGKYVLPGGENYRELLLTMPLKSSARPEISDDELIQMEIGNGMRVEDTSEGRLNVYGTGNDPFIGTFNSRKELANAIRKEYEDLKDQEERKEKEFKSSHWDEPNILAHVRFNNRNVDGKNILFIEEIQSDWAQKGKREGFKGAFDEQRFEKWYKQYQHSTDPSWDEFLKLPPKEQQFYKDAFQEEADQRGVVPNMPFKKTDQWAGLAIRRMIKYAIDEGFDAIAWTTGEQQAERYDLSKVVESVIASYGTGRTSWKYKLFVTYNDGNNITEYANTPEELESYVGKELADKIVNEVNGYGSNKTYAGLDLKVGGSGMKAFYDEILPSIANKIGKKYNAKVGEEILPEEYHYYVLEDKEKGTFSIYSGNSDLVEDGWASQKDAFARVEQLRVKNGAQVHSLPITDSMFNAFREGVPMFRRAEVPKPQYETGYDALARYLEQDEADDQRYEAKTRIENLSQELNTPVKAINNRNELPPRVQAQAKRIGVWENETMYGAWDEQTGTMFVLLDDLMKLGPQRAIEEGIKTVLHEAVAHKGLPILLGDRGYDNLVNEIYDSIPDDDLTLIRYQYGWTEDKKLIAEEYLGMMAEDNVNPSLFQRIIAKIRQLLRKYFKVAYSKNDVYTLLRASRKNLQDTPEEERGFYRSRPQPENFEYAGEFVQAQGTYFRTRKAASVKRNSPLGKAAEAYMEKAAKRTGEETIQGIREYIQDLSLPIRRFEEELLKRGGKQDNSSKPYRDMSLSFGRQEKMYNDYFEGKMKPILQAVADIKRAGIPGENILPYIIAKHAIERNQAFRSRELKEWVESHKENVPQDEVNAKMEELKDKDYSGVMGFDTDKTYTNPDELARDIVSEFEGQVDVKLINNLWKKIGSATTEILDTWVRGHQITPEQRQEYLSQFRFFVPLRGWREGAAKELVYTKGEGFSRSLQYAKGRKSLAENPLAYLLNVQFQAIAEQVDNEVKTSMVNLIIKNLGNNEMHEMATIKKLYYVKITLPDGTEEWEPTIARPPQEMFDAGDAKTKIYSEHERLRKPRQAREHEVYVRKPGGDMVMVFNGKYLSTAQAMNKQNYMYRTIFGNIYDARDINKVMALMGHMNNMLKGLYTSWNVVFPFTNFMRDLPEASITQYIKTGKPQIVVKQNPGAFGALLRRMTGKPDMSRQIDRDLEDFYNYGGATGYTHSKTPEEIEKDINKEIARMVRKGTIIGGIGNAGHTLLEAVEHWNRLFEDATRFSVYLSSLAIGNTKEDAAYDAKEASVNFNTKGKGTKAWDAWFAFYNVAVQSMQKNFKLAKDYPGRFSKVAFSFVMLGFLEAMMNAMTDDEDDPDSSYYNLNPYMRQNYLVIPLPKIGDLRKKSNKYLSVPLPQFWRGFKSIGSIAFDVATGKMKAGEAVTTALGNFAGGLLPVDIGGFYKSGEFSIAPLVPTITKPVVELIENRNYMGYTIKKEPFTREQKKYLANAGLGKDNVNPAAKFFTDLLFRWSGGDSRYKYYTDKQGRTRKVLLDVNPSTVEHLFKGYTGGTGGVFSDLLTTVSQAFDKEEDVDFRNVPFVDRFIRKTPEAKWNIISEYYDLKSDDDRDVALMKEYEKKGRETGDVSQYSRMATDEYRVMRRQLFDTYEDRISDLTKTATKDDMETADLVIEMMDRCIGQVKELEARYRRKY